MKANISKKEFGSRVLADTGETLAEGLTAAAARRFAASDDMVNALVYAQDRLQTLIDADEATDNDIETLNDINLALRKAGLDIQ